MSSSVKVVALIAPFCLTFFISLALTAWAGPIGVALSLFAAVAATAWFADKMDC